MPTYTYKCTACNDVLEKRQSFSDPPLTTCEQCGGTLRKVIHPVGIVFKGSGWYITDSRSTNSTFNGPSGESSSSKEASKEPTKKAESEAKAKDSSSSSSSSSTSSSTSSKSGSEGA